VKFEKMTMALMEIFFKKASTVITLVMCKKERIVIFGSTVRFSVSANLMVSFTCIFTPDRPLLPWQQNLAQKNEIWKKLA